MNRRGISLVELLIWLGAVGVVVGSLWGPLSKRAHDDGYVDGMVRGAELMATVKARDCAASWTPTPPNPRRACVTVPMSHL